MTGPIASRPRGSAGGGRPARFEHRAPAAADPGQVALRLLGDLNVHVAASTYGEAETCHAAVLHHWVDLMSGDRPVRP